MGFCCARADGPAAVLLAVLLWVAWMVIGTYGSLCWRPPAVRSMRGGSRLLVMVFALFALATSLVGFHEPSMTMILP